MKYYHFILLFILSNFTGILAQNSNRKLPESLSMETLTGQTVQLNDYVAKDAKVTVVNFWATWCKPCKEELDNINADYLEDWKSKYDIRFIAVSMDDSRTKPKVKGEVDTKGWSYEILCNPDNSAYQAIGFNSCPYTLLLDAKGNIVYKHTGYKSGDEEELEKEIKKAKESKTEKTETVESDTKAAAAETARMAAKKAQEIVLEDAIKALFENIKTYQALLKEEEKGEDFNKKLEQIIN